jgi:hypothetical protein
MKFLFLTVLSCILGSPLSFAARAIYVQGSGSGTGYCSYNQGPYCISGVQAQAERSAVGQAEQSCRMNQGDPLSYTASCNGSCFPSVLSPQDVNTMVRCSTNCQMQCNVAN